MRKLRADNAEMQCEHCGQRFHYDEGRRCWTCDSLACPGCMNELPGTLCPECRATDGAFSESIEPMLGKPGDLPASSEDWAFEFKWDGVRALAYWDGERFRLESRNLADITFRYPELHDLGDALGPNAILDGEIVALDENGRPSFSLLQQRMHLSTPGKARARSHIRVQYYIFDLLHFNGRSLMDEPYERRRGMLDGMAIEHSFCRVPPSYLGEGKEIMDVARRHDLEGVMCKRLRSLYTPGRRTGDWRKVKLVNSREFIIGGFKYVQTDDKRIGSLLLGAYDADMNLRFVGAAGTGFSATDHRILLNHLEPARRSDSPFENDVDRRGVVFVTPNNVAEIEYRRWPAGGLVQQAAYKGLRTDKYPSEILLEET